MRKRIRVGIVSIMDYTNFGNRLQNYAVSYLLKSKFGCKVKSLRAVATKAFYDGNHLVWFHDQIAKKCCFFPVLAEKKWGASIVRWANFYNWSDKYIPTKVFYGCKSLPRSTNQKYDVFFAGSDQIWNYHFSSKYFDDYFLKFSENSKKSAIAGSFGVSNIPADWEQTYIDGLSSFAYLSVREEAGAEIIKRLLGKDVPVLVDPVMLLSQREWLKVSKKPRVDIAQPYVLKYYLGDEDEEEKIDLWAQKRGYKVYELLNENIVNLYSAGPGEFISLIANATLVASDSFHCIAFSIIFRRPFLVYERRGECDYMTSRLDTLLNKFGLQNRWKRVLNENEYDICDFSKVDALMEKEQMKALNYINEVLKSAR